VFDNLSSGWRQAVRWGPFVHGDIRDGRALREAIADHGVVAAIHFASLIEVGRSVRRPDLFYDVNVCGTATLLSALHDAGVHRLVFSSSAAVYGDGGTNAPLRLAEDDPKDPTSPYGDTKLACERMIAAHCRAFGASAVALRYFNACGADDSGLIGEAHDPETHLIPLTIRAALKRGAPLSVFGVDFDTPDGSCIRDYIHVSDLADAHVRALNAPLDTGEFLPLNVGVGEGRSVLEVIEAVSQGVAPVSYVVDSRRAGDPARLVADPARIRRRLGWEPLKSSLTQIVKTAANWHKNPAYGREILTDHVNATDKSGTLQTAA
jgi:UDP-glucose-4-epimerase GalE